jgi:periplasmic protein TonB
MPRDLFGDVTRPSISIGNRKWYTVPVSLLSHSVLVAMFVVLPILAAPMMPGVLENSSLTKFIDIVPPTPPPAPRKQTEIKPVEPSVPPIDAPTGFTKEPERPDDFKPIDIPVGTIGGDPNIDRVLAPPPVIKPPAPDPGPVRVGGVIRVPLKTKNVDPVYPPIAQAARVQGIVIIEATISADGKIINARILRSVPLLDQAALDAVRQWEFTPSMLNGVPVPVIMTVTVQFTLSR